MPKTAHPQAAPFKVVDDPLDKLSEPRQVLAFAIETHATHVRELANLKAARARTSDMEDAAVAKVEAAKANVEEERQRHHDSVVAAARAGLNVATAEAVGLREARMAVVSAEDELEAVRAALKGFDDELVIPTRYDGKPLDAVTLAAEAVTVALVDVIKDEIDLPQLVDEANAAFEVAKRKRAELVLLHKMDMLSEKEKFLFAEKLGDYTVAGIGFRGSAASPSNTHEIWPGEFRFGSYTDPCVANATENWEATMKDLRSNPEAPVFLGKKK